jgi:hypothetical protein
MAAISDDRSFLTNRNLPGVLSFLLQRQPANWFSAMKCGSQERARFTVPAHARRSLNYCRIASILGEAIMPVASPLIYFLLYYLYRITFLVLPYSIIFRATGSTPSPLYFDPETPMIRGKKGICVSVAVVLVAFDGNELNVDQLGDGVLDGGMAKTRPLRDAAHSFLYRGGKGVASEHSTH